MALGTRDAFVVNVNWNSFNENWNVNTWNRNDNKWNEDKRVFSPEIISFLHRINAMQFLFAIPCAIRQLPCQSFGSYQTVMHIFCCLLPATPTLFAIGISRYLSRLLRVAR